MATGDLHLLGTLYTGNTKRLMPTYPYRNGGNITAFSAGQVIEIRDTDAINTYKLRWREVLVGAKKLLVSDRNILHSVSWDDLDAQGLIFGKEITIDGQQYKLRVMTGGSNYRSGTDGFSGGAPMNNEWDQFITRDASISGLPVPSAADLTQNTSNRLGVHNQFWNWYELASWVQESSVGNGSLRAGRGYSSARFWSLYSWNFRSPNIGWRPVLEVLHTPPDISVNVNGTQRIVQSSHTKVNGVWRDVDSIYVKVNGIWRKS